MSPGLSHIHEEKNMSLAEVTTAHRLAAYREELTASGFSPEAAQALVVEAAHA